MYHHIAAHIKPLNDSPIMECMQNGGPIQIVSWQDVEVTHWFQATALGSSSTDIRAQQQVDEAECTASPMRTMHHHDLRVEGGKGAALLRSDPRSPEPTREEALLGIGPRLTDHRGLTKCSPTHLPTYPHNQPFLFSLVVNTSRLACSSSIISSKYLEDRKSHQHPYKIWKR